MSVPTAELTAPAVAPSSRARTPGIARYLAGGRVYLALGGVALAIGALSLLIPSTPSYDPWAWLVWGREVVHLNLHTAGGPSWKPLPMMFTTLFALFGHAQPDLWLIVARAGAVMAVAMSFKIAWRLTRALGTGLANESGSARIWAMLPSLLAGVVAAGSLINSGGFISDNALGYSEGLATALGLIAVDRYLDGAPRQAFVVGILRGAGSPRAVGLLGPLRPLSMLARPGRAQAGAGVVRTHPCAVVPA